MADRLSVSTLNDFWWKWKSAVRASIFARLYCFPVTFLDLVQGKDRNIAQLAMVIGIVGYRTPRHRKTNVRCAAFRCRNAPHLFYGVRGVTAQPGQFRAPILRVGLIAKSD
jgi:hypothetical protein